MERENRMGKRERLKQKTERNQRDENKTDTDTGMEWNGEKTRKQD
jgi:hypothetical protein